MTRTIFHPNDEERLGNFLVTNLENNEWLLFRGAVAFAKNSGVKYLYRPLINFTNRDNTKAILTIGIDARGTSYEALMNLHDALKHESELWIYHNRNEFVTFHPKLFLFSDERHAKVAIGSGNLTEGGLFINYEAFALLELDLTSEQDLPLYTRLINILDEWRDERNGFALPVTEDILMVLKNGGKLPTEIAIRQENRNLLRQQSSSVGNVLDDYFQRSRIKPDSQIYSLPVIPATVQSSHRTTQPDNSIAEEVAEQDGLYYRFFMTLLQTDVGYGQTRPGTSRRSPEIFVPLSARDTDPIFWGWRAMFTEDPNREGKFDRHNVPMLVDDRIELINMMTWPVKSDFRLRSEALRRISQVDDILILERADGSYGYQYKVRIVEKDSTEYPEALANCTSATKGSRKRWGYL